MADRQTLLQNMATIIADYRKGEIAAPNPAHIDMWVKQFPQAVQEPILDELTHVFGKTYFDKKSVRKFLTTVISSDKLAGKDPTSFWKSAKFLDLQTAGNSQRDMLAMFDSELQKLCGLSIADCGQNPQRFVYLDDALYSGGRIKSDLVNWIKGSAPAAAKVEVITIALHSLGQWFASKDIAKAAQDVGKTVDITWWRVAELEDRKAYMSNSDVLRPTQIPNDPATKAYVEGLGADPILRTGNGIGHIGIFSSGAGRQLLEQEFLKGGVRVRQMCPQLNVYMRPLGCSLMKTTGFGSTIVTYRNCANNTPLVLWAGNPWYPLFPRKTN